MHYNQGNENDVVINILHDNDDLEIKEEYQNTQKIKAEKELFWWIIIIGAIAFLPFMIIDFYIANTSISCHNEPTKNKDIKFLKFTLHALGTFSLIFMGIFFGVYAMGGFTKKSYDKTQSVELVYYVFTFGFSIIGIQYFLNKIQTLSYCNKHIINYFVTRCIQNITFSSMWLTSMKKQKDMISY